MLSYSENHLNEILKLDAKGISNFVDHAYKQAIPRKMVPVNLLFGTTIPDIQMDENDQSHKTQSLFRIEQLDLLKNCLIYLKSSNATLAEKQKIFKGLLLSIKYQIDRDEINAYVSRLSTAVDRILKDNIELNQYTAEESMAAFNSYINKQKEDAKNNTTKSSFSKKMLQKIEKSCLDKKWLQKQDIFYNQREQAYLLSMLESKTYKEAKSEDQKNIKLGLAIFFNSENKSGYFAGEYGKKIQKFLSDTDKDLKKLDKLDKRQAALKAFQAIIVEDNKNDLVISEHMREKIKNTSPLKIKSVKIIKEPLISADTSVKSKKLGFLLGLFDRFKKNQSNSLRPMGVKEESKDKQKKPKLPSSWGSDM